MICLARRLNGWMDWSDGGWHELEDCSVIATERGEAARKCEKKGKWVSRGGGAPFAHADVMKRSL